MFFHKAKEARLYATLETIQTHRIHQVKPCKKFISSREYFGRDYITGFTVVLIIKGE
jgi:hypothetical protein